MWSVKVEVLLAAWNMECDPRVSSSLTCQTDGHTDGVSEIGFRSELPLVVVVCSFPCLIFTVSCKRWQLFCCCELYLCPMLVKVSKEILTFKHLILEMKGIFHIKIFKLICWSNRRQNKSTVYALPKWMILIHRTTLLFLWTEVIFASMHSISWESLGGS